MAGIVLTRDEDACVKCGECEDACPHSGDESLVKDHVILQEPGEVPHIATQENCIGCLSCKDVCRSEAISVTGIDEIESILSDPSVMEKTYRIM